MTDDETSLEIIMKVYEQERQRKRVVDCLPHGEAHCPKCGRELWLHCSGDLSSTRDLLECEQCGWYAVGDLAQ